MKITGLALVPPRDAEESPKVTPELLASCLARYSRSNKGIDAILGAIDWSNPDAAVDSIFKFVDYGHASIGGLTGSIPIAVDGCSLLLAFKLFELAQLSDGQESSTRYILLSPEGLVGPADLGVPAALAAEWRETMSDAFSLYETFNAELDAAAKADPRLVRAPAGTPDKVMNRMRKNYALDRARYFIPVATRNNIALVMTARVWAQVIRTLDSYELPEFRACAAGLRRELDKFTPRLTRHSHRDEASVAQARSEIERLNAHIAENGCGTQNIADQVRVSVSDDFPDMLPNEQSLEAAFAFKKNRYSAMGERVRRTTLRCTWNNLAFAELRDLNRHRSGHRFTTFCPAGFYTPPEIDRSRIGKFLERYARLVESLAKNDSAHAGLALYAYQLGTQMPFEHSTHLDKFIYEIELRTGLGAHYRYAEHLRVACEELLKQRPEYREHIELGTAEPE